jgi:hypothetical protein
LWVFCCKPEHGRTVPRPGRVRRNETLQLKPPVACVLANCR